MRRRWIEQCFLTDRRWTLKVCPECGDSWVDEPSDAWCGHSREDFIYIVVKVEWSA